MASSVAGLPHLVSPSSDARRPPDFVPLILDAMAGTRLQLRGLSSRCGLGKSRLGLLLHRDPDKRTEMTLHELQVILDALNIDLMQALVRLEALTVAEPQSAARYASLIAMLSSLFRALPANLIAALEDVDAMDGTEVRPEWAPALQRAVIKRLVHEVSAVTQRRAMLSDFTLS